MKRLLPLIVALLLFVGCCKESSSKRAYWLDPNIENPNLAAKKWFKEAKFGMFVHLNLASLLEYGKNDYLNWVSGEADDRSLAFVGIDRQTYNNATTEKARDQLLYDKYLLPNFDPEKICQLAKAANINYITFTTHHLGGCYNFKTSLSDFNSYNAPVQRDLVAEMMKACNKYQIPLFLYVPPKNSLTTEEMYDRNRIYLTELLTQYGDVAGIWFDGIGGWYSAPSDFTHLQDLHQLVRHLQPQALISFKEGAWGDEDFISPEHFMLPFEYDFNDEDINERLAIRVERREKLAKRIDLRWDDLYKYKLREVNTVMQECRGRDNNEGVDGGWINDERARHYTGEEVYRWLTYSRAAGANMLMNIGPRGDGSIHPDDIKSLTEVGQIINERGWPTLKNEVEIRGL